MMREKIRRARLLLPLFLFLALIALLMLGLLSLDRPSVFSISAEAYETASPDDRCKRQSIFEPRALELVSHLTYIW